MDIQQYFGKQFNPASIREKVTVALEASFRLVQAPLLPGEIRDRIISVSSASLVEAQRWTANKPGQHLVLETSEGEVLDVPFRIADSGQVVILSQRLAEDGSPIESYYASDFSDEAYARLVERYPTAPAKSALDEHFATLLKVKAVTAAKESGDLWFSRFGAGRYQLTQIVSQLVQASKPVRAKAKPVEVPDVFGDETEAGK